MRKSYFTQKPLQAAGNLTQEIKIVEAVHLALEL
jgi:hypothetical protein